MSIRKIKVMHVMQNLEIGGLENGVVNLVNRIDRNEFDVSICCLRGFGCLKERVSSGVKIININEKTGFQLSTVFKIASLCRREAIDVIHTHGWAGGYFSGVIGAKLSFVPVILNGEHGTMYFERPLRALAQKLLARIVDGIVPVCGDLKKNVISNFKINGRKVFPVINGVDTEKFRPDSGLKRSCRKELGIGSHEFVIGSVGRLVPVKDYSTLIRAVPAVIGKVAKARLLLVGDGVMRRELEALAVSLGVRERVIFAGAQKNIPGLLNVMDIFVLPSVSEGLSNTILEAMSTGVPVVATNVGGNTEIVLNNETGVLTPVGDGARLSEEIVLMSQENRRVAMGIKARNRIIECFSIQRMVSDYEKLYQTLYAKKIIGSEYAKLITSRSWTQ